MDSRLYFVLGDLFSNVLVGIAAGLVCAWIIPVGWNMFFAMLIAMAIGMAVGMLLWFGLGILFGAMEVMVSTMFSGMLAGMFVGMDAAMMPVTSAVAAKEGAVYGLVGIVIIWIVNNTVRGPQTFKGEG